MTNTISVIIKFTFEICGNGVTDRLVRTICRISHFTLLISCVHLANLLSIHLQRIQETLLLFLSQPLHAFSDDEWLQSVLFCTQYPLLLAAIRNRF